MLTTKHVYGGAERRVTETMRVEHWSNGEVKDMAASEILYFEVTAEDYERGQLEQLQHSLNQLTKYMGAILDRLPEADQRAVLSDCFMWRPL